MSPAGPWIHGLKLLLIGYLIVVFTFPGITSGCCLELGGEPGGQHGPGRCLKFIPGPLELTTGTPAGRQDLVKRASPFDSNNKAQFGGRDLRCETARPFPSAVIPRAQHYEARQPRPQTYKEQRAPRGSLHFTFKTSSTKRRKVAGSPSVGNSPRSTRSSSRQRQNPPSDLETRHSNQSLPHLPRHRSSLYQETLSSLSSSPIYLPPHLHSEIREGSYRRRSVTPEISPTAASSPSAAYANLNLESDTSGEMSSSDGAGGNPSDQDVTSPPTTTTTSQQDSNDVGGELRSSSPAVKRPASDMGGDDSDGERKDTEMETPSGSETNDLDAVVNTPKAKQSNRRPRHKRETSVDMLGQDEVLGQNSTGNSTTDETNSSNTDSIFPTPSNASTQTNSTRSSGVPKGSNNSGGAPPQIPSIDDQVIKVLHLMLTPLEEGQKGYAVTSSWLNQVLARSSQRDEKDPKYDKIDVEGDVGPVDNSDIVLITDPSLGPLKDEAGDTYFPLRPGVVMGEDFEILPQEAWDMIMEIYGLAEGSPVIIRYVRNTNPAGDIENNVYELHPPVLTILKLPSPNANSQLKPPEDQRPIRILAARQTPFNKWLKQAKQAVGIDLQTKVRVWRILGGLGGSSGSGMITPVASRSASPAPGATIVAHAGNSLVLELDKFLALQEGSQRELLEAKDMTSNEKYNGSSTMEQAGIGRDDVVVLDEQVGGPAGGEWTSDSGKASKKNNLSLPVTKSGTLSKSKAGASGRSSPALGAMMTRGRQRRDGKPRGITGLSNLGNTCYMNSALQCVRSVEELTQYFLRKFLWCLTTIKTNSPPEDKWKQDLNPNNPLAYHGEVAKQYANLLGNIYSDAGPSSFAPRQIKATIGKYGSSFSGYGQQDSQEFLGFLLDGLTEDLNRVLKKPYIEKPDSTDEMVNDPVALQAMADKCWDIYTARSDSVITDLFGGMYKSTVVCPVCDKVSIIFDPFNNLTLQIPVENLWSKDIFYFPLHKRPIRVSVDIDKNSSIFALKQYVATRMNSDPKKLIMVEIYKFKIYKMFDNVQSIAEAQIAGGDELAMYEVEEVPTNYNPDKVVKQRFTLYTSNTDEDEIVPAFDSPKCDRMLVPIFNRCEKSPGARLKTIFGAPSYMIITREEAKSLDAIQKKCLAEVMTMTTRNFLSEAQAEVEDDDSEDELAADPDTVVTNEEDYSSSDSKIQAGSVEGEDSLVDVSMRDEGEATQTIENEDDQHPKPLPRLLHPDSYLPPSVTSMFNIKVFKSGSEVVPIGWSVVDEHKEYISIESRAPLVVERPTHGRRPLLNDDSSQVSDEDIDDPPEPVHQQLPRNEDDSDYETSSQPKNDSDDSNDDAVLPSARSIIQGGGSRQFIGRKQITYSKKGKKFINKQPQQGTGPYLRPGEGIILDWNHNGFQALFGGETADDMRGMPTWTNIDQFNDPELEKKRQFRLMRRQKGFSLDDCLDEFGKAEILSENDAWYCPRCKEHRRASKKFELWKSPDILVIHFKRFSANRAFRDKLDLLVDFPVEGLDLTNRVADSEDKSLLYDLIAVDNHYGGLGGGHYTAYAKNFIDGNWYEYNGEFSTLNA